MRLHGKLGTACALMLACRCLTLQAAEDSPTRLLRQPAVSKDHLAFVYGGDIWICDRDGGHPVQLTSHPASEFAPHFSPDGKWIAFSANYDNNTDVYVIPVGGGEPRRLTWHPAPDIVTGWSADGKRVLFVSNREVANSRSGQFYEVSLEGGYERKVMKAVGVEGSWSADGRHLAYRPYLMAYAGTSGWRQHRGGDTPAIWIVDPTDKTLEKIPHENASDSNPMWIGEDVAFISDRNDGAANIFLYDAHDRVVRQLTHEKTWDIRNAGAYGDTVVYEAGGELKSLDVRTGQVQSIPIHLSVQAVHAREQWRDVGKNVTSAWLSRTGKRVLVTARGDVFSVPVKDGSVRNLTATPGVRESDALWSQDGQRVAYVSDAGGAQALYIRDAAGLETPVRHALGRTGYFSLLSWSPDGKRIVFHDNHLHLYAIELAGDAVSLIDTSQRRGSFSTSFSPDSQWLAYTLVAANYLTMVRLHSFATGKSADLADNFVQTDDPIFGDSDLLYFTASIDAGPTRVTLDMSTQERPLRKAIYAAVLSADGKSPMAPKTGDEEPKGKDGGNDGKNGKGDKRGDKGGKREKDNDKNGDGSDAPDAGDPDKGEGDKGEGDKGAGDKGDGKSAKADRPPKPTRIDLQGLSDRLAPIPVAERNYDGLIVASDGALFYLSRPQAGASAEPPGPQRGADAELYRYSFEDRAEKMLKSHLLDVSASANRKKLLLTEAEGKMEVADANEKLEAKPVDLSGLRMRVDPRQEWHQIFDETWRMEKEFFYDPNMHGLDWDAVRARYEPLLEFVQRREDLNDLLIEMIGELQVGHNRVSGGDIENERPTGVGLLGADFTVKNGQYRIEHIYRGDRWNPFLVGPLAAAGVKAAEGDAILAVNGHALDGRMNLYALLAGTVDKQVTLTLSRDGSAKASHTVVVIPIASESALRQWEWVERNRAYVQQRTGGKVAYVYLPDTADGGFTFFNRMFFSEVDKDALIVDDRRNSGGQAANYVLEVLNRKYLAGWKDRDGLVFNTPAAAIYGPKVMLIDQDAGSGGDFFPYGFRYLGLGKLIGTRTWGGLIGIAANPPLIDGARLTVPFFRFYTPEGEWRVENEGVSPDMEVTLDPLAVNEDRDPQLDAAITEVLEELKTAKSVPRKTAPPVPTQIGR
jgi:tricorn protease